MIKTIIEAAKLDLNPAGAGGALAIHNLLDFVAEQGPKISIGQRGQKISPEFKQDLELAGTRALGTVVQLTSTARGREKLFMALDGISSNDRSRDDQFALLDLLTSLTEVHNVGLGEWGQNNGPIVFIPAASVSSSTQAGGVTQLDPDCACAVGSDLRSIYVSSDLGFRDLFLVTQTAVAQAVVLQADSAGIEVDFDAALTRICGLFGFDPTMFLSGGAFGETTVGQGGKTSKAYFTAKI